MNAVVILGHLIVDRQRRRLVLDGLSVDQFHELRQVLVSVIDVGDIDCLRSINIPRCLPISSIDRFAAERSPARIAITAFMRSLRRTHSSSSKIRAPARGDRFCLLAACGRPGRRLKALGQAEAPPSAAQPRCRQGWGEVWNSAAGLLDISRYACVSRVTT